MTKIYADECLEIICTRADSDYESSSHLLLSSVKELHQPGGKHRLKNQCLLSPEVLEKLFQDKAEEQSHCHWERLTEFNGVGIQYTEFYLRNIWLGRSPIKIVNSCKSYKTSSESSFGFVSVLEAWVWMENILCFRTSVLQLNLGWIVFFQEPVLLEKKALTLVFLLMLISEYLLLRRSKCTLTLWWPPSGIVSVLCKLTFDCILWKLCFSFLKYVFFIKKIKSSDEIAVIHYVIRGGMKCLFFYLEKIWQINSVFSVLHMQ